MGIQINGNNDIISALDGSWTAEGASINTSGILTATTFKGNIVGTAATFTGPVTIGGTLTYEDVTNIDSVGLITARAGINLTGGQLDVGNNIKVGNAGVITATSFVGSGANLTGITQTTINNNANDRIITGSGTANTLEGESTLTFDSNGLKIHGTKKLYFGDSGTFQMNFSTHTFIEHTSASGNFYIQGDSLRLTNKDRNETYIECDDEAGVKLKYANTTRCETTSAGIDVSGAVDLTGTATSSDVSNGGMYRHSNAYTYFSGKSDGNGAILSNGDGTATFRALNPGSSAGYAIIETGNGDTRLTIASTGELLVGGHSAAIQPDNYESHLEVHGTATDAGISILRYSANSAGPTLLFGKSRGASIGAIGEVQSGDSLGKIEFYGTDTGWESSASIRASADGEWYSGGSGSEDNTDAPGRLEFHTTPNGADNLQERMRIANDGAVNIGGSGDVYDIWNTLATDQNVKLQLRTTVGEPAGMAILQERGDSNGANLIIGKSRGGSGVGAISSGDQLGYIKFSGADGTRQHNAAGILAWNNGTIATGRVAGNLSFYTAPDSVSGFTERVRITSGGEMQYVNGTVRYENTGGGFNQVRHLEFPIYFGSGTTHTVVTVGGSLDSGFVCFAVLEYIGLYSYASNPMSGGVRRAYTRRTHNNTQWRDFDDQVHENVGENYRPNLNWDNGVLKVTTPGSTQITGWIRVTAHANGMNNFTLTRN